MNALHRTAAAAALACLLLAAGCGGGGGGGGSPTASGGPTPTPTPDPVIVTPGPEPGSPPPAPAAADVDICGVAAPRAYAEDGICGVAGLRSARSEIDSDPGQGVKILIDEADSTSGHEQRMFEHIRRIAPDATFARPARSRPSPSDPEPRIVLLGTIGTRASGRQEAMALINAEDPDVINASYGGTAIDGTTMQSYLASRARTIHVASLPNPPFGNSLEALARPIARAPNGVAVSSIRPRGTRGERPLSTDGVRRQYDCGAVPEDSAGNRERTCFVSYAGSNSEATALVSGGFALLYQHYRLEARPTEVASPAKLPVDTVAGIVEKACDTARIPPPLQEERSDALSEEDYGCGMLDVDAARAPTSSALMDMGYATSQTSPDFGDQDMIVQDEWGLPHRVSLQGMARERPEQDMGDALAEWLGDGPRSEAEGLSPHAGWAQARHAAGGTHGRLTLRAFSTDGSPAPAPFEAHGAELRWQAGEGSALHMGWLREPGSAAGVSLGGSFGRAEADTAILGWSGEAGLAGWTLSAHAETGFVDGRARGGHVLGTQGVRTSALSLRAERDLPWARVRLSLSQPVRIESGALPLMVPDRLVEGPDGQAVVELARKEARLEPDGREVRLGVRMDTRAGWSAGAVLVDQPGHRRDAGTEMVLLGGWRASW